MGSQELANSVTGSSWSATWLTTMRKLSVLRVYCEGLSLLHRQLACVLHLHSSMLTRSIDIGFAVWTQQCVYNGIRWKHLPEFQSLGYRDYSCLADR